MSNVLDCENLNKIFDIDIEDIENIDEDIDITEMLDDIEENTENSEKNISNIDDVDNIDDIDIDDTENDDNDIIVKNDLNDYNNSEENSELSSDNQDYVNENLKRLLTMSYTMMQSVNFILRGAPDAESIASASTLINSIKSIISELNKAVLIRTRFEEQMKLEQMKIQGRENLAKIKAENKRIDMGSGNTFIQNNQQNNVSVSQEDITKMISDATRKQIED